MDEGKIAILEAEFKDQESIIKKLLLDVEDRARGISASVSKRESLGYKLHSLYCAFEDLFVIIADFFENTIDDKKYYHRELLRRMKLDIAGIRPSLLSEESYRLLDELRSFRHYFRHAYNYELDVEKLKSLVKVTGNLKDTYLKDFLLFLSKLEEK